MQAVKFHAVLTIEHIFVKVSALFEILLPWLRSFGANRANHSVGAKQKNSQSGFRSVVVA